MKFRKVISLLTFNSLLAAAAYGQAPSNDNCSGAITLTSGTSCTNTTQTLNNSTVSTSVPPGCVSGSHFDVWFQFVAVNTSTTVTISSLGSNITNPEVAIISACGVLTNLACGATSATATGLTIGQTYLIRVSNVGTNPAGSSNRPRFNICVTHPPLNDECSGAINLNVNNSCSNTTGSLINATPTIIASPGCAAAGTHYDTWYRFTASQSRQTIAISSLGSNFTNPRLQLFSGTCAGLTSIACGTTTINASGLTPGQIYYIRVSNLDATATTNMNFSICVTNPARVEHSRSYINITKGTTGGTIDPGDELEMRATFVVSSRTVDSLMFIDTLYAGRGFRLVPGSLALRTNEGKVYKSFTDAFDTDWGYIYTSGGDTVIRMNFGTNATQFGRGQLSNTSKPSVFNGTCIVMATYRVIVYAPYNTAINFRTGRLTYRDAAFDVMNSVSFTPSNLIVYQSPGLCPNAVSATNALGAEFNGTFGAPSGLPLARNRSASLLTSYNYTAFSSSGGPQDYFHGITNNTSSGFTTVNTWPKPDATRRVFSQWDISGDHTGAANASRGNPACDTTQPISASNPCGYMLVINSAYRADTAFTYTVSNLCPNTYYEISGWFKNICYKCGCDSNGTGSGSASYIPTAPGDSSGVYPNIAFDVNGIDYYTTGDIRYLGLGGTATGSDSLNQWVKRGFVYLTGPNETSFTLTLRNNAPGGGGNDWALDDISVATCLPNMSYSPSLNPTTCRQNAVEIADTIRSYFNNYQFYKWQRSTDAGATWTDVPGTSGSATPTWNGSSWEYITSYTIPPSAADTNNNGDRYRVVVSTTSGNLTNTDCQVTDGVSIINLNVLSCEGDPMSTSLLSFNARRTGSRAQLDWSTSQEHEPVRFRVQRSTNGSNFQTVATIEGRGAASGIRNAYAFVDTASVGLQFYRISMINSNGGVKLSRVIRLHESQREFGLTGLENPFRGELSFELASPDDRRAEAVLLALSGAPVRRQEILVRNGVTSFRMTGLESLPEGVYILKVQSEDRIITRKVVHRVH